MHPGSVMPAGWRKRVCCAPAGHTANRADRIFSRRAGRDIGRRQPSAAGRLQWYPAVEFLYARQRSSPVGAPVSRFWSPGCRRSGIQHHQFSQPGRRGDLYTVGTLAAGSGRRLRARCTASMTLANAVRGVSGNIACSRSMPCMHAACRDSAGWARSTRSARAKRSRMA